MTQKLWLRRVYNAAYPITEMQNIKYQCLVVALYVVPKLRLLQAYWLPQGNIHLAVQIRRGGYRERESYAH